MESLYDLGYMDIRKADRLKKFVELTGALVVDARFSPRSRNPEWNKGNLEILLGERYVHLKELGNKNYKGGDIDFVDLPAGLALVASWLESLPVIIMCGCWDRQHCHRTVAVLEFASKYGVASIPLTSALIQEKIDESEPKQLNLF